MPYLIDRRAALFSEDIVAIVRGQHRGVRSRVILRDGSLYQTLTRPGTLLRYGGALQQGLARLGAKRRRTAQGWGQGTRWLAQP